MDDGSRPTSTMPTEEIDPNATPPTNPNPNPSPSAQMERTESAEQGDSQEENRRLRIQNELLQRELQEMRAQMNRLMQTTPLIHQEQPNILQQAAIPPPPPPFSQQILPPIRQQNTQPLFNNNQHQTLGPALIPNVLQPQGPDQPAGEELGPGGTFPGARPPEIRADGAGSTGFRPANQFQNFTDFAAPLAVNHTAPAYAGVSRDAHQPGGCPPHMGHGQGQHGAGGATGGRCCNQLPPLKPFDPEQGKREFELFELEFQERMKLENINYNLWGRRLLLFLDGEARSFGYRWLKSQTDDNWNFHTLIAALRSNFQIQNSPDWYQRKLNTFVWDPTKIQIEKH
ncbi:MAG: hypothetical protein GY820_29705, partial [Gammaproteobacteria bacterium]|nr:hypothetical protein [Gammaproteobacteria bacterium]